MRTHLPVHQTRKFTEAVYAAAALLITCAAPAQNLFVSDIGNGNTGSGNIYEFTPGGVKSTFASGLSIPLGLTFDNAGNLFEADQTSGNIYKFTPGGVKSTFASGLYEPQGLAFDSAGNLYEIDFGSHNANTGFLHKFTTGGVMSTIASGLNPTALAISSSGDLFVTDIETASIYKFTPGGVQSTFDSGGLYHPFGLAFNSAGDLFESEYDYNLGNGTIYEFTPGGVKSTFATGLTRPMGLAFNSADNLFVADYGTGTIYEYTPGGVRSTFASGLGINGPTQLAFQPVPEPSSWAALIMGSSLFFVGRQWQRRSPFFTSTRCPGWERWLTAIARPRARCKPTNPYRAGLEVAGGFLPRVFIYGVIADMEDPPRCCLSGLSG